MHKKNFFELLLRHRFLFFVLWNYTVILISINKKYVQFFKQMLAAIRLKITGSKFRSSYN